MESVKNCCCGQKGRSVRGECWMGGGWVQFLHSKCWSLVPRKPAEAWRGSSRRAGATWAGDVASPHLSHRFMSWKSARFSDCMDNFMPALEELLSHLVCNILFQEKWDLFTHRLQADTEIFMFSC